MIVAVQVDAAARYRKRQRIRKIRGDGRGLQAGNREFSGRSQRAHRELSRPVELLAGAGRGAETIAVLELRLGAKIAQCKLDRTQGRGKWLAASAILEMHLSVADGKRTHAQCRDR